MENKAKIKTMAECQAEGKKVDLLFWVGCAGSYDARAIKISKAFTDILDRAGVNYAILGEEENCCGDPARRAGNEFVFQMLALQNIETLKAYEVNHIVTTCPHGYNTLKNEYPKLGGEFKVQHHTQYLLELIDEGKIESGRRKIKRSGKLSRFLFPGKGQWRIPSSQSAFEKGRAGSQGSRQVWQERLLLWSGRSPNVQRGRKRKRKGQ
jgi:Fe-S oxidoreductase